MLRKVLLNFMSLIINFTVPAGLTIHTSNQGKVGGVQFFSELSVLLRKESLIIVTLHNLPLMTIIIQRTFL